VKGSAVYHIANNGTEKSALFGAETYSHFFFGFPQGGMEAVLPFEDGTAHAFPHQREGAIGTSLGNQVFPLCVANPNMYHKMIAAWGDFLSPYMVTADQFPMFVV
jgi:hypothetical protein